MRTIARERSQRRFDAATALRAPAARGRSLARGRRPPADCHPLRSCRSGRRAGGIRALRDALARRNARRADAGNDRAARCGAARRAAGLQRTAPVDCSGGCIDRRRAAVRRPRCRNAASARVLAFGGRRPLGFAPRRRRSRRREERDSRRSLRGWLNAKADPFCAATRPGGGEHRPYEAFVEALQATPDLLDDQMSATLTDDRAARLRLFDSVRRRLSEASRRRVVALVLEDLHWAGRRNDRSARVRRAPLGTRPDLGRRDVSRRRAAARASAARARRGNCGAAGR